MIAPHSPPRVWLASAAPTADERSATPVSVCHSGARTTGGREAATARDVRGLRVVRFCASTCGAATSAKRNTPTAARNCGSVMPLRRATLVPVTYTLNTIFLRYSTYRIPYQNRTNVSANARDAFFGSSHD